MEWQVDWLTVVTVDIQLGIKRGAKMVYLVCFESGKSLFFNESWSFSQMLDYADSLTDRDGEYTVSEYDSEEDYQNNL